jgi:hypothetical protein
MCSVRPAILALLLASCAWEPLEPVPIVDVSGAPAWAIEKATEAAAYYNGRVVLGRSGWITLIANDDPKQPREGRVVQHSDGHWSLMVSRDEDVCLVVRQLAIAMDEPAWPVCP